MNEPNLEETSQVSMRELFRTEAENQTAVLISGLLALERDPTATQQLDVLMRAAHSLKGAARMVNHQEAVRVAHALEDCFVAARQGQLQLRSGATDVLLRGVDLLVQVGKYSGPDPAAWELEHRGAIHEVLEALGRLAGLAAPLAASVPALTPDPQPGAPDAASHATVARRLEGSERMVRLSAENLNRLLALAGESLVDSRWLRPFAASLERLKRHQTDLTQKLDEWRTRVQEGGLSESAHEQLGEFRLKALECEQFLSDRLMELDMFDRRSAHLSQRLYLEVLRTRMRPFGDGTRRFARMVRDLARSLGKEVRLELVGEHTPVDRDILERLETPLAHLLRNAVDHGCESPEQRKRAGKGPESTIRLEARHSAGMLLVSVLDDGAGVAIEEIRQAIVRKQLAKLPSAARLSEPELLEYLFLPGFTLKEEVTEISGRGVGLDVVQNMVKSVRGNIRLYSEPGRGLRAQLQLPLTLSVLRALLVEIAGESYAIPLAQISRTLELSRDSLESFGGRQHFRLNDQQIGLVNAQQVLECGEPRALGTRFPVVVVGERSARYGLVVDRLVGQRELLVQPLDPRLGKIRDISAAALLEDGSPILIIDVDDMLRSIGQRVAAGTLAGVNCPGSEWPAKKRKRVLTVDDSMSVRELERKLLANHGYLADVAVDGLDAWNAVRTLQYDLVVTDVDMPRMDGVELASLIKRDPRLRAVPVMIVSYKDDDQDRARGLAAGADYYLTKSSFQEEILLQAVVDLIGEPEA